MEDLREFKAYVRDNPEGLADAPSLHDAQTVLRMLHHEGMKAGELLQRCLHYEWGLSLVCTVMVCFHQTQGWWKFVCELVNLPVEFWQETEIKIADLMQAFGRLYDHVDNTSGHAALSHWLKHDKDIITQADHPFCLQRANPVADAYWKRRVRAFIVRPDFKRAWDEINKARKGLLLNHVKKENFRNVNEYIDACKDPDNRCWYASNEVLGQLAIELYNAMLEQGIFANHISEDDLIVQSDEVVMEMYSAPARSGRHEARTYKSMVARPAWDFARRSQFLEPGEHPFHMPYRFQREGISILRVAEYFKRREQEKRREKHEAKMAAHVAKHD